MEPYVRIIQEVTKNYWQFRTNWNFGKVGQRKDRFTVEEGEEPFRNIKIY